MEELHLEIVTGRYQARQGCRDCHLRTHRGLPGDRDPKIEAVEGKSPNRHNRFYFDLEVLPDEIVALIKSGEVSMNQPMLERRDALMKAGMDKDEAKASRTSRPPTCSSIRPKVSSTSMRQWNRSSRVSTRHSPVVPLPIEPVQNLKMTLVDVKAARRCNPPRSRTRSFRSPSAIKAVC